MQRAAALSLWTLFAMLSLAAGCSGGEPSMADSSVPLDTATPSPDEMVALTPCPPGWREIREEDEPTVCEPWPVDGRQTCDRYSGHFPGEAGCTPIGTPCPTGDFEEGLSADGTVLFVKGSATGGDGSAASPFGSISEALTAASAGSTIALAKGTYDGAFVIPGGVTIRGACVPETHLTFEAGVRNDQIIALSELGSALENVSVSSGDALAVTNGYMAEGRIEDVVIEGSGAGGTGWGINHIGAVLVARNVLLRDLDLGIGFYLEEAEHRVEAERIIIENSGNAVWGISIHPRASFNVRDSSVRNMTESAFAVDSDLGITEITRTVIEDSVYAGYYANNGGVLIMTDTVIRDISSDAGDWDGFGIAGEFTNISRTEPGFILQRVLIERVRDAGIYVYNSILDAQALVIRDVQREACTGACIESPIAAGLAADEDGSITADGFYISNVDGCGVNIGESGEIDLANGDVRGSLVGACIRDDGYDVGRLTDGVSYSNNMSNLDSTSLPVPTIDGAGGEL